ncbi:MAG TPA: hypothetical protein VLG71_03450 [Candidatus Limnocylindria bacterium]|nr:hypothetical protein [Candidatus Limnocylindria bacterium]
MKIVKISTIVLALCSSNLMIGASQATHEKQAAAQVTEATRLQQLERELQRLRKENAQLKQENAEQEELTSEVEKFYKSRVELLEKRIETLQSTCTLAEGSNAMLRHQIEDLKSRRTTSPLMVQ